MSACKRGNDPNHGGGFEVVRNLDAAYIDRIPTEVFANARHFLLHVRFHRRETCLAGRPQSPACKSVRALREGLHNKRRG